MKLIATVITLLGAIGLAEVGAYEIEQLRFNGTILIKTSYINYGLTSISINQYGWKTVSKNGDNVVAVTSECLSTIKSYNALSESEQSIIGDSTSQLFKSETPNAIETSKFSADGSYSQTNSAFVSNNNRISINKYDDNNFSVKLRYPSNNFSRIFVNEDVVTFVSTDGQVQMKPMACLQPAEQQMLEQFRVEIKQEEEKFKQNMERLDQDMQNLSKNMENMQHNLNNMFSNGFPFNQDLRFNNQHSGFNQQNFNQNSGSESNQMNYRSDSNYGHLTPSSMNNQINWQSSFPPHSNWPFGATNRPFGNSWPFGPENNPFGPGFSF